MTWRKSLFKKTGDTIKHTQTKVYKTDIRHGQSIRTQISVYLPNVSADVDCLTTATTTTSRAQTLGLSLELLHNTIQENKLAQLESITDWDKHRHFCIMQWICLLYCWMAKYLTAEFWVAWVQYPLSLMSESSFNQPHLIYRLLGRVQPTAYTWVMKTEEQHWFEHHAKEAQGLVHKNANDNFLQS